MTRAPSFAMSPEKATLIFAAVALPMPLWAGLIGAGYPDLLQKFAIFGVFAIGFNLLFGLTGYLSFGHAAFLGVGSYAAVWTFKLLTMNVLLAVVAGTLTAGVFAAIIGYVCLRRSGIYFSILTLALAQMCYNLAYSVLTPITNGETGLQLAMHDPRWIDNWISTAGEGLPPANLFGLKMSGYPGFYFCAAALIAAFWFSARIFNSPLGLQLRAIKSNQQRMAYTGYNARPHLLGIFFISGMYAGLAGSLLAATDPLAGAERMQWTASGEVVLMTILGGAGTLVGPLLGASVIKYFENIFSAYNPSALSESLNSVFPPALADPLAAVVSPFVGDGWHLTLGMLFVLVVIFLPGGIMEGMERLMRRLRFRRDSDSSDSNSDSKADSLSDSNSDAKLKTPLESTANIAAAASPSFSKPEEGKA